MLRKWGNKMKFCDWDTPKDLCGKEILVLQPVVHGHWIKSRHRKEPIELNRNGEVKWLNCIQCSHCGAEYAISDGYELYYKYCPTCAAKMDGENE